MRDLVRLVSRSAVVLGLAALVVVVLAGSALATTELRVTGPVRFVAGEGGVLELDGSRRYFDTLELTGGPTLVNELSLEAYVAGVDEMPERWPEEALKAQAVAARTYAWYSSRLGTFAEYDICATTACQVFRGADVVLEGGGRWRAAVQDTAGEVLVDAAGDPILARYFSTSGGRTYANEEVFPRSGPRPYLVGIDDPDDAVSPYHRWTVPFTREEFDTILARGETLAAVTPVAAVTRLGPVDQHDAAFRFTGRDGTEVEVSALALRDFLSEVAPRAYPDRFPTARSDGLRPLPTTVPSTRFEVVVEPDRVLLEGRGWGHGVGMGQYGARGRAERGEDHTDILAAYYAGTRPSTPGDLPQRIRVGMPAGDRHTIRGDRPVTITDRQGTVLVGPALGAWSLVREPGGWLLRAPEGSDVPLEVSPTRQVAALLGVPDAVTVEAEVNKPVVLRLEVRDAAGTVVLERELGTAEAGTHAATWRYHDEGGDTVPAGHYEVALRATDAHGDTAGAATVVSVDPSRIPGGGAIGGTAPRGLLLVASLLLPISLIVLLLTLRKARA